MVDGDTGVMEGTVGGRAFYIVTLEANICGMAAAAGVLITRLPVQEILTFHSGQSSQPQGYHIPVCVSGHQELVVPGAVSFVSFSLPPPNSNRTDPQTLPEPSSPAPEPQSRGSTPVMEDETQRPFIRSHSLSQYPREVDRQSDIPTEIIFQFLIIGHKSRPREIDFIRSFLCKTLHLPLRSLYFCNF